LPSLWEEIEMNDVATGSTEVLYEVEAHVATITLNAPERMNTLSTELTEGLANALVEADSDPEVRAVVLTGAGRAFCAGLDLRPQPEGQPRKSSQRRGGNQTRLYLRDMPPAILATMDKPVIAAVNGGAAGYGLDLALGADVRIVSENAKLSVNFVRQGLVPESGVTWLLPRLLGWEKASDMLFAGRVLKGQEAVDWGLARRCVPDAELLPAAKALAAEFAANAPFAVQAAKRMMRASLNETLPQHMHHAYTQLRALMTTADTKEGMAAFMAKRQPVFINE
jgi:enoyl-CoA hydratase/carnithine racemase